VGQRYKTPRRGKKQGARTLLRNGTRGFDRKKKTPEFQWGSALALGSENSKEMIKGNTKRKRELYDVGVTTGNVKRNYITD